MTNWLNFIDAESLFQSLKELPKLTKQEPRARVVREVFEDAYNYMKSGQLIRQVVNKINDIDFNNLAERQHFGDIYEQILNDLQSAGNAGEYYTPRAVTSFMTEIVSIPGRGRPYCSTQPAEPVGSLTCAHPAHARAVREASGGRGRGCRLIFAPWRRSQLPHMLCRHQHAPAQHRGSVAFFAMTTRFPAPMSGWEPGRTEWISC